MFYSQLLLSQKGALGIVWMAAHCHKRLKKHQVQQTSISSSVDKILDDEVPAVTHRILAFLLLGVVRIYSKKVEYLFHDCYEVMKKLHGFKIEKREQASTGVSRTHYHSITLPKRFELDAFDLEQQLEHQDFVCENVRSDEPVMLSEDGCPKDDDRHGLICKAIVPFSEAPSTACTPPRDVFSPHIMEKALLVWPSSNVNISLAGGASLFLENRLDPMVLDEAEEDQMHNKHCEDDMRTRFAGFAKEMESHFVANPSNKISHSAPSLEILRGSRFSEDHLDLMALDEPEVTQIDDRPSTNTNFLDPIQEVEFDSVARPSPQGSDLVPSSGALRQSGFALEHSINFKILSGAEEGDSLNEPSNTAWEGTQEQVDNLRTRMSIQENEPNYITEAVDTAKRMTSEKVTLGEVNISENRKCQRTVEFPISIVTPDSKISDAEVSIPEVTNVQTPATKERTKILKKRKTLFDQSIILSNKVLKSWIEENSSVLKRQRRKVPLTLSHAWRASKLGHTPDFLDTLFFGMSNDLSCLVSEEICPPANKSAELSPSRHEVRSPDESEVVHKQIMNVGSHVAQMSPEQTPIAPGTPVAAYLNLLRSHDMRTVADSEILEPTTSLESIEKPLSSEDKGLELDSVFKEIGTNSLDKDSRETTDGNSIRTRMIQFLEEEEEALNVSQLLQDKTKKESARLFYEILVLKTMGYVHVDQANAYDDILLRQSSRNLTRLSSLPACLPACLVLNDHGY